MKKTRARLAIMVLLGGAALWWVVQTLLETVGSTSDIHVVGSMPVRDLRQIRRLVRHEIWRGVFPRLDWWSLRQLPANVRCRAGEHISGINSESDGTVQVETLVVNNAGTGVRVCSGHMYKLKSGKKGWQIIDVGDWIE